MLAAVLHVTWQGPPKDAVEGPADGRDRPGREAVTQPLPDMPTPAPETTATLPKPTGRHRKPPPTPS